MSKLLDFLNALDANAALIHAYKQDPHQATRDFGLSVEEQAVLLKQDRKEISAFLDIPFKDFDSLDTTESPFDMGGSRMCFEEEAVAA